MDCKNVMKIIQEDPSRLLSLGQDFFAHIKECDKCLEEYRAAEAIELAKLEIKEKQVQLPKDFNLKIWKRIKDRQPGVFELLKKRPFAYGTVFAGVAAFATVVFMILPGRVQNLEQTKVAVVEKSAVGKALEKKNIPKVPVIVEMAKKKENSDKTEKLVLAEKKVEEPKKSNEKVQTVPTAEIVFSKVHSADAVAQGQFSSVAAVKVASSLNMAPNKSEKESGPNLTIMKNVIRPLQREKVVIKYKTSLALDVIVQVFDERGRLLKSLVRGPMPVGMHETVWDGKDEAGAVVGAGAYIVYIKTDLVEEKIKVVVIK